MVRPGDVVLDIGTGTGILAAAAARAGARRVYAVEAGAIGKAAQAVFETNGLSDRVTLIEGWSTEIDLPEKADVLVSEILSHDVFGESVLETTLDARQRLLKPGARLIPAQLSIFALPVVVPDKWLSTQLFTPANTRQWQEWYQVAFTPLVALMQTRPLQLGAKPDTIGEWTVLSEPAPLLRVDLTTVDLSPLEGTATHTATGSGRLNGVVLYFEAALSPTTRFTTHPLQKPRAAHWINPVWVFPGVDLKSGDRFKLTLRYKTDSDGLSVSQPD
jgi:protein arginine N-methyltransferase 1